MNTRTDKSAWWLLNPQPSSSSRFGTYTRLPFVGWTAQSPMAAVRVIILGILVLGLVAGCSRSRMLEEGSASVAGDRGERDMEATARVRQLVFEGRILTGYVDVGTGLPMRSLLVPKALVDEFTLRGNALIEDLLCIARFGRAQDALLAIGFAQSLLHSPTSATWVALYAGTPELIDIANEYGTVHRSYYVELIEDSLAKSR